MLEVLLTSLLASVVLIETALARLGRPALLTAAAIILACYSIFFGLALGFEGKDGQFRKQNPHYFPMPVEEPIAGELVAETFPLQRTA